MATSSEIRAWAAENGVDCPPSRVSARVRDLYTAAHETPPSSDADTAVDATDPETTRVVNVDQVDAAEIYVVVNIPGANREHVDAIAVAVLEVIEQAFAAGVYAERARIAAALGMST